MRRGESTLMSELPPIDVLDRDGALREAADGLDRACGFLDEPGAGEGHTRAALLRRAAAAGGLLAGGGALFGLVAPAAGAKSPAQDRAILNYALTLEYLESSFYARALAGRALSGETLTFAQVVGRHENAHVTILRGALGRAAVARPRFDFGATVTDAARFRTTALLLEDTGVSAYGGQVTRIKSPRILVAAAQIHAVEARHAAWIADIINRDPAPEALNPVLSRAAVLGAVRDTGFIQSS